MTRPLATRPSAPASAGDSSALGDGAPSWRRLERLVADLGTRRARRARGQEVTELCRLHRATSRDLSQAIAEGKPQTTVRYLHGLVSRTHALLYRFETVDWQRWREAFFVTVPAKLRRDPHLRVAFAVFFGVALLSYALATVSPAWLDLVLDEDSRASLDAMYSNLGEVRSLDESFSMSGFYVRNNMTVALRCFAYGAFFGVGSVAALLSNAITIGAAFGYMLAGAYRENFLSFVIGHAPFELTAVTFAGAAGLKLGLSLVRTQGWSRAASFRRAALDSVALVTSACVLLLGAALIEAFFSPLPFSIAFKLPMFLVTLTLLVTYVAVLGGRGGRTERGDR
ncbi:MAG: stage II sporulation protein M [bacterium]